MSKKNVLAIKVGCSGIDPKIVSNKKGKETMNTKKKPRPKRKKGFQVFKTIAALKLASRNEGVSTREMSEKLELSTTSAYGTLKALVESGEVAEEKGRFYSDVYADGTTNPLIVRGAEPDTQNETSSFNFKVTEIILDNQADYLNKYPAEVFGAPAIFLRKMIVDITMNIMKEVNEIE